MRPRRVRMESAGSTAETSPDSRVARDDPAARRPTASTSVTESSEASGVPSPPPRLPGPDHRRASPLSMQGIPTSSRRRTTVRVWSRCAATRFQKHAICRKKQRWFWVPRGPCRMAGTSGVRILGEEIRPEDGAFRMAMDARSSALGKLVRGFRSGGCAASHARRRSAINGWCV